MTAYFSEGTFNLAKEVVVRHLRSLVINVIDCKTQFLYLLEVIVKFKSTRELWTQAILHILCPSKLHKRHVAIVKQNQP